MLHYTAITKRLCRVQDKITQGWHYTQKHIQMFCEKLLKRSVSTKATEMILISVAEALIKRHPCLSEPGSFNGCYGWKQRLKTIMGNYRTVQNALIICLSQNPQEMHCLQKNGGQQHTWYSNTDSGTTGKWETVSHKWSEELFYVWKWRFFSDLVYCIW